MMHADSQLKVYVCDCSGHCGNVINPLNACIHQLQITADHKLRYLHAKHMKTLKTSDRLNKLK